MKLSEVDKMLLQARHLINEIEKNHKIIDGHISTIIHPYAYGYFKNATLKLLKDRKDLHERNPDLFDNEERCVPCRGEGRTLIPFDSERYREFVADAEEWKNEGFEDNFKDGDPVWDICGECSGVGIKIKDKI